MMNYDTKAFVQSAFILCTLLSCQQLFCYTQRVLRHFHANIHLGAKYCKISHLHYKISRLGGYYRLIHKVRSDIPDIPILSSRQDFLPPPPATYSLVQDSEGHKLKGDDKRCGVIQCHIKHSHQSNM